MSDIGTEVRECGECGERWPDEEGYTCPNCNSEGTFLVFDEYDEWDDDYAGNETSEDFFGEEDVYRE